MPTNTSYVAFGDRRYVVEPSWPTMPDDPSVGVISKAAVDSEGFLYVCQRISPPIIVFAPDGRYARSFGAGQVADSHGIFITDDDRVIVVDRGGHQVFGFDKHGELLFTLGERSQPRYQAPFNHPTDVAVGPAGDLYVTDGYGNTRVHRFSPDGALIRSWGSPGSGPSEFTTPHGIGVLPDGRVLVGDRENNRIQVFDSEGDYLTEWRNFYKPMDIFVGADRVYVTDQIPRATALDFDGTVVGACMPTPAMPHGVAGDGSGNLYFIDSRLTMITRLAPL